MDFILNKIFYFLSRHSFFKVNKLQQNAIKKQQETFLFLIKNGRKTLYGKQNYFEKIKTYQDFKKHVNIKEYEDLKPYIKKISRGEKNILWPGKPLYFCETSGTTSGLKYIPLTKEALKSQITCMKDALFSHVYRTKNFNCLKGFWIFLQGSPVLYKKNKIKTGRLSGIVASHVPFYLKSKRLPSFKTNSIDQWEPKLNKIIKETLPKNMTAIAGIPPWLIMYFEKMYKKTNKKIKNIFPNLSLIIYGGVNYKPYQRKMYSLLGGHVKSLEIYPASEGFVAYQNDEKGGLFLCLNNDIFYEFIKVSDLNKNKKHRLCLEETKLKTNYALVINSSAGLWGYLIGDTVEFISLNPYKIIITGRTKHFCSAFGEHLIIKEIEEAIQNVENLTNTTIEDFHLYPYLKTQEKGGHVCIIESFETALNNTEIEKILQASLIKQNHYYKDLIQGNIINGLKVITVKKGIFNAYMKKIDRLGGQNKPQRISNNDKIAKEILLINETR